MSAEPKITLVQDPNPTYAALFGIRVTGTDVTLLLQRSMASVMEMPDGTRQETATPVTVGTVVMSPQAAKDLWILLEESVGAYEREFGALSSDYQRRKANK